MLIVRVGSEVFAISAHCTHYHGPLAEGIIADGRVRCPWHHACLDPCTGEAVRPPALNPVDCWNVEQKDGRIFVKKRERAKLLLPIASNQPNRIIIVGGGAAGFAAAEMLRRRRFGGSIVMLSNDATAPVDRPNLSKDYLAGNAPEDWLPLRPDAFYAESGIDLHLNTEVVDIDPKAREVAVTAGKRFQYDRLLLATGAEPVRLPIPGGDRAHVLRSLADCRAIIAAASNARRALIIGASFIGLEVAASLRMRNIEVVVVAPEARPMERVLGPQMGDFIRGLHEERGVVFRLQDTVIAIDAGRAMLKSGGTVEADFVVVGVGVRPRLKLAEQIGLTIDRGVAVNQFLEQACRACTPPATLRAGLIHIPAHPSASNTGSWPNAKVRPRQSTC